MTLVKVEGGVGWQEVAPSCCLNGHPWTRPGSFRVVGHHVRSWECQTLGCDSVVTEEGVGPNSAYPAPPTFT